MKITYIFSATGNYSNFIDGMVRSGIEKFFPNDDVDFIGFTDREVDNYGGKLRIIKEDHKGWPMGTLKRFHLINSIADTLDCDYLFYGNANMIFNNTIGHEILPVTEGLVAAIHPIFCNRARSEYPYDRNPNGYSYVAYGEEGEHYYQGCFSGGKREDYLAMSKHLQQVIDEDLQKVIMAQWLDESYMNKYLITHIPKALHSGYIYPERAIIPFEKNIIQLDKTYYGGHDYFRTP